jgi:sulfur dioxygenase
MKATKFMSIVSFLHHHHPSKFIASRRSVIPRLFAAKNMSNTSANKGGAIVRSGDIHKMGLKQLFDDESSTYTYLLWDDVTKDAILVDPVDVQVERDLAAVKELGLQLVYGVNTHAHADHITGTGILKQKQQQTSSNSKVKLQSVISEASGAAADIKIADGDRIVFGSRFIDVRATPGHTVGCLSFVADDKSFVLTGDTLLIQGCGRTDFQGGSSSTLYDNVHAKLFSLPDSTVVYPAHDYKGRTSSSIGDEKETNPRLGKHTPKAEFEEIMANLNLSYPKKIDVSVPANMRCGVPDV